MHKLAGAGFRSVVSNRPDGEEENQPDWATVEGAARAAGMKARHIPVVPGAISDEQAAQFKAALEELPGPVVAFCRTSARAVSLWALANAGLRLVGPVAVISLMTLAATGSVAPQTTII